MRSGSGHDEADVDPPAQTVPGSTIQQTNSTHHGKGVAQSRVRRCVYYNLTIVAVSGRPNRNTVEEFVLQAQILVATRFVANQQGRNSTSTSERRFRELFLQQEPIVAKKQSGQALGRNAKDTRKVNQFLLIGPRGPLHPTH